MSQLRELDSDPDLRSASEEKSVLARHDLSCSGMAFVELSVGDLISLL